MSSRQQDEIIISSNKESEKFSDPIELGEVELYHGKRHAMAIISKTCLEFKWVESKSPQLNPIVVLWEDFVNIFPVKVVKYKEDIPRVQIISYPVFAVTERNGKKRKRLSIEFTPIASLNEVELQENWVNKIKISARHFAQNKYKSTRFVSDAELLEKKHILVLVNPFSGTRAALKNFQRRVAPFLREAGVDFELYVTERAGHARERMQHEDLTKWDALLFVSGDGLVSEALNGLLSREDAKNAIQIPFGIVPCGSGNTMIGNILYYSHEEYSILNAAFVFVKGLYGPSQSVDVGLCKLGDVKFYFLLCFNLGFVNDVTFESEVARRLGDIRFTIFAIKKIMFGRHPYRADISYLPHDDDDDDAKRAVEDISESSWVRLEEPFSSITISLLPMLSHKLFIQPTHKIGSGHFSLVLLPYENIGRIDILKLVDKTKLDDVNVFSVFVTTKIKAFRITPIFPVNGNQSADGEFLTYETCYGEISPYKLSIMSMIEKDQ